MITFSNKKVAVLGFGVEGQDVCRFLKSQNAMVTVFDQKILADLHVLPEFQEIDFKTGSSCLDQGLVDFEIIFRSPGIKRDLPAIIEAEKRGSVITSATKLFFDLCPAKIIGVTGTKGKGTTATLVSECLKAGGKETHLAGNIGTPALSLLPQIKPDSWVVLELSSFQLQDLEQSPHIAVVLFVTSEHLDYHCDEQEYVAAKSNILRYQAEDDFAVINYDSKNSRLLGDLTKANKFYFSRRQEVNGSFVNNKDELILFGRKIGDTKDLLLRGEHNWENVCAAMCASSLAGIDDLSIRKAIFAFKGLEHRLELVGAVDGVKYYNDSFSTIPETTIAAIKSFTEPIILIAGGSDKGSDFKTLGEEIARSKVKTLVVMGKMTENIIDAVTKADFNGEIIRANGGMKEVLAIARQKVNQGDVVLLSPACASFDMFENYKDRGNQFKLHVNSL